MCNVFIHQLLEFSVFKKPLGSLNLDGHNIRTRFCCYLLFLPMFYDFFVECFYCKIWSRDNWQVAFDNDWIIAWLCNLLACCKTWNGVWSLFWIWVWSQFWSVFKKKIFSKMHFVSFTKIVIIIFFLLKVLFDGLTTLKSMAEVNKKKFWRDK
jgi:hypothetical protein